MSKDVSTVLRTRLRQLRTASHLSQEQLAERATLNYKHYQEIERGGKKEIRLSTLAKIAAALHVPVSQLFTDDPVGEVIAESETPYRARSLLKKPSSPSSSKESSGDNAIPDA